MSFSTILVKSQRSISNNVLHGHVSHKKLTCIKYMYLLEWNSCLLVRKTKGYILSVCQMIGRIKCKSTNKKNKQKTATLKKTENWFSRPIIPKCRSKVLRSILQCFRPSLSYHLPLRSLFCLFLSGPFTQVLL